LLYTKHEAMKSATAKYEKYIEEQIKTGHFRVVINVAGFYDCDFVNFLDNHYEEIYHRNSSLRMWKISKKIK